MSRKRVRTTGKTPLATKARLTDADVQEATNIALAQMAAALATVNDRLDAIEQRVERLFDIDSARTDKRIGP